MVSSEIRRDRFYQEIAVPQDVPFICVMTLERNVDKFVALAAVRSQRDGPITTEQKEVFSKLAVHMRAAIRMQLTLTRESTRLLAGTMDMLSVAAFFCDRRGGVRAMTPSAEKLISGRPELRLTNANLGAVRPSEAKALSDAINAAAEARKTPGEPTLRTVVIGGQTPGTPPIVLDVFPLPVRQLLERWALDSQVLVVARGPRGTDLQKSVILKAVYGFTSAECEIALAIAAGRSVEAVAADRRTTVGTVRQQIKGILLKAGVSRQLELSALINRL